MLSSVNGFPVGPITHAQVFDYPIIGSVESALYNFE
jgi:hypothetical protein